MPLIAFDIPAEGVHVTPTMPTPKKMADIGCWYKDALKAIPNFPHDRSWVVRHTDATVDYVRFELVDKIGIRAHITIKRRDTNAL